MPLAKPVTVHDVAVTEQSVLSVVQLVAPSILYCSTYPLIGEPPSEAGGTHDTVAYPLPTAGLGEIEGAAGLPKTVMVAVPTARFVASSVVWTKNEITYWTDVPVGGLIPATVRFFPSTRTVGWGEGPDATSAETISQSHCGPPLATARAPALGTVNEPEPGGTSSLGLEGTMRHCDFKTCPLN